MTASGRHLTAVAGIVCLVFLAGCATEQAAGSHVQQSSCPPSAALRLFGPQAGPPRALSTAVNPALAASFAIFRRPAAPGDLPPAHALAGGKLGRELARNYELASYYGSYVRRLTIGSGGPAYAVPALARRAAAGCLPGEPQRKPAPREQPSSTQLVLCILEPGRDESAQPGCQSFAAVDEDLEIFASEPAPGQPVVELIPDGVASVRISYRSRAPIVVPVSDNALSFTPPPQSPQLRADENSIADLETPSGYCTRAGHGPVHCTYTQLTKSQRTQRKLALAKYAEDLAANDPAKVEWLDSAGRLVRAIAPPTAASLVATAPRVPRAPIGG